MGVFSERVAAVQDAEKKIVTVPEWGDLAIEVHSLSLAVRNQIATTTRDKRGQTIVSKFYAALLVASCYDPESGEKAFDASDMEMLQGKNGAATDRLARIALELSGLSTSEEDDEEDQDALNKAIDDAGKASFSTETSGSDS